MLAYNGPNLGGIYTDPIGHWVVAMLATVFILITVTAYVVFAERVLIGVWSRRLVRYRI